MKPIDFLTQHNSCYNALKWFETIEQAWEACDYGDWMLEIAEKVCVDFKTLVLAKGHCVNTVRNLLQDKRSLDAIDACIAFGEDKITSDQFKFATEEAIAAADDVNNADVNNTAYFDTYHYQKQTADICRQYLTDAFFEAIK